MCDYCNNEDSSNRIGENNLCDDCYSGIQKCIGCFGIACHEFTHSDIGTIGELDYYDNNGNYHCEACAVKESECQICSKKIGKNNLAEQGGLMICQDCMIIPMDISKLVTKDPDLQIEIVEEIENNINTNGSVWKALIGKTEREEILHIIHAMRVARERHNNTQYDELLKNGIDRDLAREFINTQNPH